MYVYVFIYAALYHSFREGPEVGGIEWVPISLMDGTNYDNTNSSPQTRSIYFIYLKKRRWVYYIELNKEEDLASLSTDLPRGTF